MRRWKPRTERAGTVTRDRAALSPPPLTRAQMGMDALHVEQPQASSRRRDRPRTWPPRYAPAAHRRRPSRVIALSAVAALALVAIACGNVAPARGWPAPVAVRDAAGEQLIVIQSAPGTLTALAITPAGVAERWKFPGEDDNHELQAIYATPLVRGSTILIAAYSGDLLALDSASGRPIVGWGGKISGRVIADPVEVSQAQMFVATDHGAIHPVDLTSGTIYPSKVSSGQRLYGGGARAQGSVYYGTLDKRLFALDSTSAAQTWEAPTAPLLSSVASTNNLLVIGTLDAHVRAYSPTDGAERWAFEGSEWFWATPLVGGDVVYAADLDGRVYALDSATGAERWRTALARGNVRAAPVLAAGTLVIAAAEGAIFGLDPASGTERWSTQSNSGRLLASPLVLESGILFVSDSGALLRVNPNAGTLETLYTPK